jgi:hypothetical protein
MGLGPNSNSKNLRKIKEVAISKAILINRRFLEKGFN